MCKHWSANSFALSSGHALGPLTASNTGLEQLKRWGSQRIPTVFWSPSTIHPPSLFEKTTKHAGLAGANQPRSNEARHPGYSREGPWLRHLVGGWRSSVRRISRLGCWTWGRVLKRLTGYYICCSCMFMSCRATSFNEPLKGCIQSLSFVARFLGEVVSLAMIHAPLSCICPSILSIQHLKSFSELQFWSYSFEFLPFKHRATAKVRHEVCTTKTSPWLSTWQT